jgi:hypothetical protein
MFPFIIPALFAAVGAAVGAIATHAAGEEDRQKAKHLNRPLAKVANDRHNLAQIARNCRYQQLN